MIATENIDFNNWKSIEEQLNELEQREINSIDALEEWFIARGKLEDELSENFAWRYIRMTCDTESEEKKNAYLQFVQEIQPKLAPWDDKLNKKAAENSFTSELENKDKGYFMLMRSIRAQIEIYREENIPLFTKISELNQEYSSIIGAMTIQYEGKEFTMPQASKFLKNPDRKVREQVYRLVQERRFQDSKKLDDVLSELIRLRHQIATNAGLKSFTDYMWKSMGRFDYKPEDCFEFHKSAATVIKPLLNKAIEERSETMNISPLKPWDLSVDEKGRPALEAFKDVEELVGKGVTAFSSIDEEFGKMLQKLDEMGHLDLDSRKGKSAGGYLYPLNKTGVPFIFMNATSMVRDLVTLMHEGGHAVHAFLAMPLPISAFKSTPSEVAELASMAMELLSLNEWKRYFEKEEDFLRAKEEHLKDLLQTLTWVSTIDKFQHWLYANPEHTASERHEKWKDIFAEFSDDHTDYSDLEQYVEVMYQRQLHIYEVPFYYIEYGMAQLGAIAVWRNYLQDPENAVEKYKNALSLGYTRTIGEIYQTAGIKFDFSASYIKELAEVVRQQLEQSKV